jgi:hypothetical protein
MKKDGKTRRTIKAPGPTTAVARFPADYALWLTDLKDPIAAARNRATLSVNQELIRLYHQIAALETKLTKTRQIKQGMMQELLTGRIRLA